MECGMKNNHYNILKTQLTCILHQVDKAAQLASC